MSRDEDVDPGQTEQQPDKGPNLVLIYCLLGAGLLAAMAVAALIVLPFYQHR